MPAVFAFADKVIAKPQTSIFAAFGSFAILVFVEFGGPWRTRLLAYLGLACVGAVYITVGTLCSRSALLAAGAMAVVGFVTLYSGVISGYFAAASTGALLTFILPVTITAPNSAIPDRLEGWALAAGAGISAVMLLWPSRRRADTQRDAAGALRAVADVMDADRAEVAERAGLARGAVAAFGRRLLGTQHRPTGPTGPMAAFASLPDELDWLLSFVAPPGERSVLDLACAEDAEALAAGADVLRVSAERLDGGDGRPDFARLDAARDAVAQALVRRLPEVPSDTPPATSRTRSSRRSGSGRPRTPRVRSRAMRCVRPGMTRLSWTKATSPSRLRRAHHSRSRSSLRSSRPACARCGSRTASGAPPGSRSPSTSPSERVSNTDSGWCWGRCQCCGRTRSARAGRSSARWAEPRRESSSGR